ncbi:hypothetical protein GCM10023063_30340 [Arthrobacter methylotrophus]
MSVLMAGTAKVTMLASSWPMNAPIHTVATTNHGAPGRRRIQSGLAGSLHSFPQPVGEAAVKGAAPEEICSVTELFYKGNTGIG